jgi:predicted DNA-binding transcriptional regulator AlpA
LRRDEAAASLAVSTTKFDEWVADGRMPRGHKIDGVVLWDTQEIREAWERLRDGIHSKNPFDAGRRMSRQAGTSAAIHPVRPTSW